MVDATADGGSLRHIEQKREIVHLRNVFVQHELDERATTKDSLVVRKEGARQVRHSLRLIRLVVNLLAEPLG